MRGRAISTKFLSAGYQQEFIVSEEHMLFRQFKLSADSSTIEYPVELATNALNKFARFFRSYLRQVTFMTDL